MSHFLLPTWLSSFVPQPFFSLSRSANTVETVRLERWEIRPPPQVRKFLSGEFSRLQNISLKIFITLRDTYRLWMACKSSPQSRYVSSGLDRRWSPPPGY